MCAASRIAGVQDQLLKHHPAGPPFSAVPGASSTTYYASGSALLERRCCLGFVCTGSLLGEKASDSAPLLTYPLLILSSPPFLHSLQCLISPPPSSPLLLLLLLLFFILRPRRLCWLGCSSRFTIAAATLAPPQALSHLQFRERSRTPAPEPTATDLVFRHLLSSISHLAAE
ncbi:hypothetical protein M441DRAFT_274112 [Trichoderma asperellum CBS 433.97]|uniref:Uncharacterized protein n=1 Tax=Trichoderma asperellum (strain ATCC 204424 / CBS 433.97 / NBRC 101777) TaxID=1042311 RepID=A0A2T3YWS4_TRIA4|nr:hypothetical protein M441DRAFT_274112 [Trichoderma asperellum CBS 433.97]PTB37021.1 hypothetical protein M441DRAFT_274112 [Trichoderma asperellum CBS 433.97]WVH32739.1 hypothetical protein [Trichoderma asperellum]